ncbi:hypothetical protein [Burkholderia ubonensis]|uniref:hypothetical protein n=1 Tax=Burkholderia ubonensis TaxID=101571 RepID=UPI001E32EE81|nr:hypothetical protein [Burkholderia ubonensis]
MTLYIKEIGTTQLADLLIEMDVHTGFSETLLARRARCERTGLAIRGADRMRNGS